MMFLSKKWRRAIWICLVLQSSNGLAQHGDVLEETPITDDPESLDLESGMVNRRLDLNRKFWTNPDAYNLFTEKEILEIRAHINAYGKLLHIHELQQIIRDVNRIRELAPYIQVGATNLPHSRSSNMDIQIKWDNAADLTCESCLPSPIDIRLRSEIQLNRSLRIGLVGETDRGEMIGPFSKARIFDLQKGYALWTKRNTQLIVGNHHLRFGEGLFSNNFYLNKVSANPVGIKGGRAAIIPSRSFMEDPRTGIAAHSRFQNLEFIAGMSFIDRDAVIDSIANTFSSWREGGYHRSLGELRAKDRLRVLTGDLHLKVRLGQVDLGLSYHGERFSHDRRPERKPERVMEPRGREFHDLGMSYNFHGNNYFLFGEWKSTSLRPPSFLQGTLISMGRRLDLSVMLRNYRPDHTFWSSSAFGAQSANKNELGICSGVSFRLSKYRTINLVLDQFIQPWFAYAQKIGSGSGELVIITYNDRWKGWKIRSQYRYTERRRNGELTIDHKFRIAAQRELHKRFRVGLRTDLIRESTITSQLLIGDLVYTLPKARVFLRTYQSFGSGELRFYMRENDLQNSFAMTTFKGMIRRNYVMWELKMFQKFKMRIKTWEQRDLSQPDSHSFGVNLQFLNQW